MKKYLSIFLLASLYFTTACEKKISAYQENESHNAGLDCMQCHKTGGEGEGNFKVAGTVYDTSKINVNPGTTIHLYSEALGQGDLVSTLEVDQKGNFYTTEKVKFKDNLYPSVVGIDGVEKFMGSSITVGNCNSCHGVTTNRIWTN
ncbi:MAG: hypothetical protein ACWA41_00320 [Putridiphycobacter sp.]